MGGVTRSDAVMIRLEAAKLTGQSILAAEHEALYLWRKDLEERREVVVFDPVKGFSRRSVPENR
ncbi:hypothetical protein F1D05_33385 [Kribbella qitaiheensis]|uniref:Uncharacterized protein n=1 Tax=Kribbella qitaiheensis TaxID=1544730 RepID=A0A7G6X6Q0_9ACTN|nr:hypothetical protein [Kribbella qitaiheensis]QNE21915.1 hypothetical protein F1D05_33385 [Kribbella qitaiheensis]